MASMRHVRTAPGLKSEARLQGDTPHASDRSHLAEGKRIHNGVDTLEVRSVENVGGLNAKFQRPRFLNGDDLRQIHVKHDLPGPLDDVSPGIAEGSSVGIHTRGAGSGGAGAGSSRREASRGVAPFARG